MKVDKKRRRIFWQAAGVLCFLIAAIFAGMAGRTWLGYQESEKGLENMYQDMEHMVLEAESLEAESSQAGDPASLGTENELRSEESVKTEQQASRPINVPALQKLNSDVAGWIRIPGTVIDYPVMHTPEDSNYYFHRDFYKNNSVYGMIYLDGSCRLDKTTPNLLIYGHHMRNGSMFASIEKYASKDYWRSHPQISLTLSEDQAEYEVMAAVRLSAGTADEAFIQMLAARTEEDYGQLMQYLKEHALYDTGITASWPDSLITLTTCEYTQKDGRFLVVARKADKES